ncbi:peptidase family C78-domain-containing protein [Lasiosphaeris hirsuta]|uniref:Peptidase family C78-domain-containing protein n=1 Tax=Lasiosphaeris hirsuta TaxID=260670 RepID=A0AA40AR61_9PEZI|nr:peptidase family C78-domain-containing protein [Lasiosphaeris hirsuta]
MDSESTAMTCPFCAWETAEGEYAMLWHMETLHAEGDSPFVTKDSDKDSAGVKADGGGELQYAECPVEGCDEVLSLDEIDYHIELHADEADTELDRVVTQPAVHEARASTSSPSPSRAHREAERQRRAARASEVTSSQSKAISAWKKLLKMPDSSASSTLSPRRRQNAKPAAKPASKPDSTHGKRLGKAQLGKYAHEDHMPDWLVSLLQKEGQVKSEGVISVLGQLLEQCSSTRHAYLCHPQVQHISKLRKEGGFCGYRNIQMLTSYVNAVEFQGSRRLNGKIPSIFQIQDFIESAWDEGINSQGRVETGGVRGTRKYIGTPEALAMFRLLDIPCDAQGFKNREPGKSEELLMEYVENYFQSGVGDPSQRIRLTNLPPIYFQHAGHSMTIIGFEKLKSGGKNLLVFDPMFHDATSVMKLVGHRFSHPFPDMSLKFYRRGRRYLRKYHEFEVLK